jgi:hypothetical protein
MKLSGFSLLALLILSLLFFSSVQGQTKIVQSKAGHMFMRNGSPYYVKGLGGEVNLDKVIEIGGNSIRTWGSENAQQILDEAQKKGLTVMLGLWLIPERHGFDYNDKQRVEQQFAQFKAIIEKYKNHPALLMWGIGNELDLGYKNTNVWNAVQDLAKFIHQTDPDHPTSTVTAGIDSLKVQAIIKMAPDIDVFCINTYGDIKNVPLNIERFGWKGPWMITEWGPNGYWESPKTSWDVSIEQTSTEKKQVYYERYKNSIEPYNGKCLGSYAFFWGSKQEYTETWFGLFSKENIPTEPIDGLEIVFKGQNPKNPAPTILSMAINGKTAHDNIKIKADEENSASVQAALGISMTETATDLTSKFVYRWKVLAESSDKKSGGDAEKEAQEFSGLIKDGGKSKVNFKAPSTEGAYRLFVSVYYNDKVAYANVPFWVNK